MNKRTSAELSPLFIGGVLTALMLIIVLGILIYSSFLEYRNSYHTADAASAFAATVFAQKAGSALKDADTFALSIGHLLKTDGQISDTHNDNLWIQAVIRAKPHVLGYVLINSSGKILTTNNEFNADISVLKPVQDAAYHRNNWIAPKISKLPGDSVGRERALVERGVWSSSGSFLGVAIILVDFWTLGYEDSLIRHLNRPRIMIASAVDGLLHDTFGRSLDNKKQSWLDLNEIQSIWTKQSADYSPGLMGLGTAQIDGLIISRQRISGTPLTVYVQTHIDPFLADFRLQRTVTIVVGFIIILLVMLIVATIRQDRKNNEESRKKLLTAEERLQFALSTTGQGLWDWMLESDSVYFSDRIQTMLGYQAGSWLQVSDSFWEHVHPEDRSIIEQALQAHFDGDKSSFRADFRLRKPSNEWAWIRAEGQVVTWTPGGSPSRMIGTNRDINEEKLQEMRLKYAAGHDPLLGILNRSTFQEQFERFSIRADRKKRGFSYIIFDIDHFKPVNDSYGHQVGDEMLKLVVERVKNTLRTDEDENFFRLGGEEFGILLEDSDASETRELADRLRLAIESAYLTVGEKKLRVTASFGLTTFQQNDTLESLMQRADKALYHAKGNGRNAVAELTSDMSSPK